MTQPLNKQNLESKGRKILGQGQKVASRGRLKEPPAANIDLSRAEIPFGKEVQSLPWYVRTFNKCVNRRFALSPARALDAFCFLRWWQALAVGRVCMCVLTFAHRRPGWPSDRRSCVKYHTASTNTPEPLVPQNPTAAPPTMQHITGLGNVDSTWLFFVQTARFR